MEPQMNANKREFEEDLIFKDEVFKNHWICDECFK